MKNDSRAIRTKKSITLALISLLKEKSFEKITIQDILDRTPVTRGTFYSYFCDKYEIVEKMHEHFFELRETIRKELKESPPEQTKEILGKCASDNRDFLEALFKIHANQLDMKEIISSDLEDFYLKESDSPSRITEAKIYAQARTEAYLAFLYDENMDYSLEYINSLYLEVSLKLLKLSDDQETREFLKEKLNLL